MQLSIEIAFSAKTKLKGVAVSYGMCRKLAATSRRIGQLLSTCKFVHTAELGDAVVEDIKATDAVTTAELQELRVLHAMRKREREARAMAEPILRLAPSHGSFYFCQPRLALTLMLRTSTPAAASLASSFVRDSAEPSKAMLALRQGPPLSGTATSK